MAHYPQRFLAGEGEQDIVPSGIAVDAREAVVRITVDDVTVRIVPAMHSSGPGGRPIGFALGFSDGRTLYHTGIPGYSATWP
jgi:hypothetical protein